MKSCFQDSLKFTTNGIRGIANRDLTPLTCARIGITLGKYVGCGNDILVGMDYRISGPMIKNALMSGIVSTGANVIDGGYTPTPALQKYVKDGKKVALGLIITASHNPPEFNGIKVIDSDGIELAPDKERIIEQEYQRLQLEDVSTFPSWKDIGTTTRAKGILDHYIGNILNNVQINEENARKLRVVVDPGNGVVTSYIKPFLSSMGIQVIGIFDEPDGTFPNRVSEPTPTSLKVLCEKVVEEGASFGVGFDGDGDRAIFIDNEGGFHWGDESFAIILNGLFGEKGYNGWIVTPVSSSVLVEEVVKKLGARLEWTKVGSITVSRRMLELGAIIAGEENGGIFYAPHQPVRDGGMALALVLQILSNREVEIKDLFDELPRYYLHKETIRVENEKKQAILDFIKNETRGEKRVDLDGVKIFKENGSVLIRPSGTEPKFRSFADGKSPEIARKLSLWGIELVKRGLQELDG